MIHFSSKIAYCQCEKCDLSLPEGLSVTTTVKIPTASLVMFGLTVTLNLWPSKSDEFIFVSTYGTTEL